MLKSTDQKALEEIFKLFKKLEAAANENSAAAIEEGVAAFKSPTLTELKNKIKALCESQDPLVQKISQIEKHLHANMSFKHFVAYLVPVERILNKNVQDDDFLVLTDDKEATATDPLPLVFVLDNIRSAFNVGSILRTAECLNIEKVYLCGYTPTPEQAKLAKTAMGTEKQIDWEHREHILDLIRELSFKGYHIAALETASEPVDLYSDFPFAPTALVVGNERFGLEREILKACDEVRKIPLRGRKNSLNVSTSLAISAFEWNRQYSLAQRKQHGK